MGLCSGNMNTSAVHEAAFLLAFKISPPDFPSSALTPTPHLTGFVFHSSQIISLHIGRTCMPLHSTTGLEALRPISRLAPMPGDQGSYNRAEPSEQNPATAKGWGHGSIMARSGVAQQDPLSEMALERPCSGRNGGRTSVGERQLSTILGFNLRIAFCDSQIPV